VSIDQQLFAWVHSTLDPLTADNSAGVPIVRRDYAPDSIPNPPRVVYLPIDLTSEKVGAGQLYKGILSLRVEVERPTAFGDGDTPEAEGVLHDLLDTVNTAIEDVVPTLTGFSCQALTLIRDSDGDSTVEDAARTLRYEFSALSGFSGVPLSGGEATLTITGYNGMVQWWRVNDSAPLNTDMTEYDSANPQYNLGDKTANGVIRFMPQENDVPLPDLGATACVFTLHDGATWSDVIKIHDRQWAFRAQSNDLVPLDMQFVIDDASSPFLTGVIV